MKRNKQRGFTLIELLVVIAIIAILAAILFPVFAQAKRAAKGSVAISGAKQMSLAQLMYSNDYDDGFAPAVQYPIDPQTGSCAGTTYPWSYVQQPYMKNWGILQDPTGPNVLLNSGDSGGGYGAFALYGLWGMPPELAANRFGATHANWTFGQQAAGKAMTGGQLWYYDGIGGGYNTPNCDWAGYGYNYGGTPSLTTTAVANPADQVMIAQSGTWDFMWEMNPGLGDFGNSNDTPDNFDLYYSGCGSNAYGCTSTICAPIARQRDNDGPTVGFVPWPSGNVAAAPLPTGLTVWAGVDGHVKATPWKELMGKTIPVTVNGVAGQAIKAFWPLGQ